MVWSLLFRLRQYWLGSLWMIPAICAVLGVLVAVAAVRVDKSLKAHEWFVYDAGTATSILSALLSATITFTGFVFTMLLLVPQFGGSQLSARVLQLTYRDPKLKLIFGVFLGTMIYVFALMIRIREGFVPSVSLWFAGFLVFTSVLLFLGFVSYFVQHLRPATAAATVANQGRQVIESVYPQPLTESAAADVRTNHLPPDAEIQAVRRSGKGGVMLAVSHRGLLLIAERTDSLLVLPHGVGEYVANGAVIVNVVGAQAPVVERVLSHLIALGTERTFEQDPKFALRILVDIAAKALSPAINDPTTAVSVIDRIEDLLMLLARRNLAIGELHDRHGRLRVVLPSPTWEEFLRLGVTEIRLYSHESIHVVQRLRSMLQDLAGAVPIAYQAAVAVELLKLDQTIAENFAGEADRAFAGAATSTARIESIVPPA